MAEFTRHTAETASPEATALIEQSQKAYGMLPNLHAVLAESPETYRSYVDLSKAFGASSFSAAERHTVMLAINVENRCHYCVPAHTFLAHKDGVSETITDALRADQPIADEKLETLRQFAKSMVVKRGFVDPSEIDAFLAAGFTKRNVFEVILAISYKTISNYVNHVAATPVDAPFAKYAWDAPTTAG